MVRWLFYAGLSEEAHFKGDASRGPADLGKGIPGKEADTVLAAVSLLHLKMERGPGRRELTAERPGPGLSLQRAGV